MMTERLSEIAAFIGRGLKGKMDLARSVAVAGFVVALVMVWAVANGFRPTGVKEATAPAGALEPGGGRAVQAAPAVAGSPIPPAPREPSIDALSAVVARKYRVSDEATRLMIGTAFREARKNGLDPLLLVAVMAVESRFNPIAESESGAMGLMQVIPRFHQEKLSADGNGSLFDPRLNIKLGALVLKEYIQRGGTESAGLQLYNGTAGDLSNAYASKVMAERQRLQEAIQRVRNRA